MTVQELRDKSTTDLHALLAEQRRLLQELRFKASELQLREVHKIKEVKKNIARILTVINDEHGQSSDA